MAMPDWGPESFPFQDTADRLRAVGMDDDVAIAVADAQAKVFSLVLSRVLDRRDFNDWKVKVEKLLEEAVEQRAGIRVDVAERIYAAQESISEKYRSVVYEEIGKIFDKYDERVSGLIRAQKAEYQLLLADQHAAIKGEMQDMLKEMAETQEKNFRGELQRVLDDAVKYLSEKNRADLAVGLAAAAEKSSENLNIAMDRQRDLIETVRVETGKAIAKNSEAIAKNSEAIAKNSEAIEKNREAIASLREDMNTMYKELRDISDRNRNILITVIIGGLSIATGVIVSMMP